jgi:hypothetical protein
VKVSLKIKDTQNKKHLKGKTKNVDQFALFEYFIKYVCCLYSNNTLDKYLPFLNKSNLTGEKVLQLTSVVTVTEAVFIIAISLHQAV